MRRLALFSLIVILFISCKKSTEPEHQDNSIKDIDGNMYKIINIGTQVWMAENLKVTHYRNGVEIPNVTDSVDWKNLTTGAYCNYDNNVNNVAIYGRLYNWYAVNDTNNLAPEGWHIPSDEEWQTLREYLGGSAGGKLKESGTVHWSNPNTGATNESGFTALPAGLRYFTGDYIDLGYSANFWSSSNYGDNDYFIIYWRLYCDSSEDWRMGYYWPQSGFSVRCLKD